jgi:thiol:disulfide interchange protein DsbD
MSLRPLAPTAVGLALGLFAPLALAEDLFSRTLARHGWAAALPAAFVVGLGTSLTPCVYPMVAITVSVFGARKARGLKALLLSSSFVLGLVAFFVPLGLFAGMTGSLSGALASSPWVQGFEAALMFAMALNMFGLFEVSLPSSLQTRLASVGGLGARGAFVIGLVTGPIAAPCATAGLVGILDYIFRHQDPAGGGAALAVYALGLGAPFFVVGTFAVSLPKPGVWMDRVKSVFGLVLVVVGCYYLRGLVPFLARPGVSVPVWAFGLLVFVGLGLGAVHLSLKEGTRLERLRKVLGIVVTALGASWLIAYEPPEPPVDPRVPAIAWSDDARDAAAQARRSHRPVLMDFGANWCAACEELTHRTFNQPRVRQEARRFLAIRVDASEITDQVEATQRAYNVRGLPTVLLFNSEGREVQRLTEFVPPERMAALLRAVE